MPLSLRGQQEKTTVKKVKCYSNCKSTATLCIISVQHGNLDRRTREVARESVLLELLIIRRSSKMQTRSSRGRARNNEVLDVASLTSINKSFVRFGSSAVKNAVPVLQIPRCNHVTEDFQLVFAFDCRHHWEPCDLTFDLTTDGNWRDSRMSEWMSSCLGLQCNGKCREAFRR